MEPILVTNFNEKLIRKINSKALVVRTSDLFAFREIAHIVNEHNHLHGIMAIVKGKFTDIPVTEEWGGIPVNLFVPEFGDIRSFIQKAGLLRGLNLRIFLAASVPENFTHLQLMASLGVDCGVWFDGGYYDWQGAIDLLHYAIYGKAPHATIEPFVYLVDHYRPTEQTDFSGVYFNNPDRYLHMDPKGNLAITAAQMERGEFIGNISNWEETLAVSKERPIAKTYPGDAFFSNTACSVCPSWRVCLGKFSGQVAENPGCKEFFQDVMEAAEFVQSQSKERRVKQLCQL